MENESVNVRVMKTLAVFDYLINSGEKLTLDEIRHRAQFCPGIMEEPELQELVQISKSSTIKSVTRNTMGLWYEFENR